MGRKNKINSKLSQLNKEQHNLTYQSEQIKLNELIDKLLRISTTQSDTNVNQALKTQRTIHTIVDEIQKLERSKDTKVNSNSTTNNERNTPKTINKFVEWAKDNGAEFEHCNIKEFDGYDLGVEANRAISESDLLIAVPKRIMLTIEEANKSNLYKLIETDQILKNMPNVTLAVFLLFEKFKGHSSFWKPYIDILPKSYTTVLYFTPDELEELNGSSTLEMALKQIKNITRQYAYFFKLFASSLDPVCKLFRNRFTFNEYRWAVSTVMTRQNTVPIGNDFESNFALIPLWDLCNHTNGQITTSYNPTKERSECLALKNFEKGEQLFIFYGPRRNAEFFIHNGFVFDDNDFDSYWIRLGISKSDPLKSKRIELLNKLNIPNSANDFVIKKNSRSIDGLLLAFLRVFNMNADQLQFWSTESSSKQLNNLLLIECSLIDKELDKKSWLFLQTRLKLILINYRTTIDKDLDLIKNWKELTLSANQILAIKMRTTEKRIIKDMIMYVEQFIKE